MNDTVKTVVTVVAATAVPTIEEKKAAYIAKLQAEIETTRSSWVKLRNNLLIATVNAAGDAVLKAILSKVG